LVNLYINRMLVLLIAGVAVFEYMQKYIGLIFHIKWFLLQIESMKKLVQTAKRNVINKLSRKIKQFKVKK